MYAGGLHAFEPEEWLTNEYRAILLAPPAVFDILHATVASIAIWEVTGTGYVGGFGGAGRKVFINKTAAFDGTTYVKLDADDLEWASLTIPSITAIVIYRVGTSDADSELICWIDQGFPVSLTAQNFRLPWSADGIMRVRNLTA